MTNVRVTAVVQATSGQELTLPRDGSRRSPFPKAHRLSRPIPADRSALKPGAVFSQSGKDVIAVWPSASAKMPSMVLGGAVK